MRILWASNALHAQRGAGYANQSSHIVPELLSMGHEIGFFAFYGLHGGMITVNVEQGGKRYSIPVFPAGAHPFGDDRVAQHAKAFEADIVISFVDAWCIDGAQYSKVAPWCPYFPVDCEPLGGMMTENLKHAFQPLVFSRFGERVAKEAGLSPRYIPHILDRETFSIGSRYEARDALGWPRDAFVATMVAANRNFPSRKGIPEALKAFALFAKKHSDAYLYLHMVKGIDGKDVNVPRLIDELELTGRVGMPDDYGLFMGYPLDALVSIYRASNVLLAPSWGEGLNMPILEAAGCGVPSIASDWSGGAEIIFNGYRIPMPGMEVEGYGFVPQEYYLPHGGNHAVPMIGEIVKGLEWAYNTTHDSAAIRAQTAPYAAEVAARDYWKPALEDIDARRREPKKVARGRVRARQQEAAHA